MNILSLSTSSNLCSVAILDNENCIKELNIDDNNTHSQKLMPIIKKILNLTNLKLQEIDLIVVDIGPRVFYRHSNRSIYCKSIICTF